VSDGGDNQAAEARAFRHLSMDEKSRMMSNAISKTSAGRITAHALGFSLLAMVTGCGPFGDAPAVGSSTVKQDGCTSMDTPHVAPGGYYVVGNTICTGSGRPHIMRGVDRPSLEWASAGQNLSASDFRLMGVTWGANVVRIALNQQFWLSQSVQYDATYADRIDQAISWAEQAGLDVILDLHWNDRGDYANCDVAHGCEQQLMADEHSLIFWTEVATRYKTDGRVLFELYNEPHDIPADVWRNGGATGQGWNAVGMQQLYETVRATGADNLVIAGGLSNAYDLSIVSGYALSGYNIMYATHPYASGPDKQPGSWENSWGFVTRSHPVIVTEFGDNRNPGCQPDYNAQLVDFASSHATSWTAWAWYNGGVCNFPSIIKDWKGTPTPPGEVIKAALLRLNPSDPPASIAVRDAGGDGDLFDTEGGSAEAGSDEGGPDAAQSQDGSSAAGDAGEGGSTGAREGGSTGVDADTQPDASVEADGSSEEASSEASP